MIDIESFYKEHLEEDIIFYLSKKRNIAYEEAIKIYYTSKLADYIHDGVYNLQYLDYHILVDFLEQEIRKF